MPAMHCCRWTREGGCHPLPSSAALLAGTDSTPLRVSSPNTATTLVGTAGCPAGRRAVLHGPTLPSERHPTPRSTGKSYLWACQPCVPSYAPPFSPVAPLWFPYPGSQSFTAPHMGSIHSTPRMLVPAALILPC